MSFMCNLGLEQIKGILWVGGGEGDLFSLRFHFEFTSIVTPNSLRVHFDITCMDIFVFIHFASNL
jgi:hypothetical protein